MTDVELKHDYIPVNGIQLHVVEAGPKDGELVIFLHGFPDFWYGWIHQIHFLAQQGYHVVAPDQRGYNLSDKPEGVVSYQIDTLAEDIVELLNYFQYEKAHIIAHDWGAIVGWWLGIYYSERITKLIILNVPHPKIMKKNVGKNIRQTFRSWYVFFFQIPALPEFMLKFRRHAFLRRALKHTAVPNAYTREDIDKYVESWSQPKALTTMINWYRAMKIRPQKKAEKNNMRVTIPTQIIWGEQDRYLGKEMVEPSAKMCDNCKVIFLKDATHWLQKEFPDKVNEHIHQFLSEK